MGGGGGALKQLYRNPEWGRLEGSCDEVACNYVPKAPVLKGSWDLTPIKVLITVLINSHEPPSMTTSRRRSMYYLFGTWTLREPLQHEQT